MSDLIYMAYAILVLIAVAVLVLITVGGFLMAATVGWKARGSHRRRSASEKRSVPARLVTRVSGEVLSLALDAKSERRPPPLRLVVRAPDHSVSVALVESEELVIYVRKAIRPGDRVEVLGHSLYLGAERVIAATRIEREDDR